MQLQQPGYSAHMLSQWFASPLNPLAHLRRTPQELEARKTVLSGLFDERTQSEGVKRWRAIIEAETGP